MYTDEAGKFKGDALVVFFKPQSVDMAIMLLDDTEFRWNSPVKMRVQAADSSYKKVKNENGSNTQQHEAKGPRPEGGFDPKQQGDQTKRRQNDAERQKIIRKTQKLSAKLADWDDDEPSTLHTRVGIPEVKNPSRWDKVVILSHMFTLQELEEDPAALLDIKEDIRDECEKLGEVTNVVLFDQEEDGIVSVKFKTPEAAEACVKLMHGRAFDGRVVEAYFATGRERFKKSKNKDNEEDDEDN
jgi:HIV Tat-specific factor 1